MAEPPSAPEAAAVEAPEAAPEAEAEAAAPEAAEAAQEDPMVAAIFALLDDHVPDNDNDVAVDARRRHEVEMELRFGPQAHAPEHGDEFDDDNDNDNDVREEQRRRQWEERQMMDREEDSDRWAHGNTHVGHQRLV
jgi:hypothetical protein